MNPKARLNNGLEIPRIGLGTKNIEKLDIIIYEGIKRGIHMIDTAFHYENEELIGKGIQMALEEKIIKREGLFVATKLWHKDKSNVEKNLRESLKNLKVDYLDLYLIHYPFPNSTEKDNEMILSNPLHEVWPQMEACVRKGLVKSIGLCNFNIQMMLDLLSYAKIKPVCNQIEFHPYLYQKDMLYFCKKFNIQVIAYGSLVKAYYTEKHDMNKYDLLNNSIVKHLATKYRKSAGQILLNWAVSQDCVVIPMTNKPDRLSENFETLSFRMSDQDIHLLGTLNENYRFLNTMESKNFGGINLYA